MQDSVIPPPGVGEAWDLWKNRAWRSDLGGKYKEGVNNNGFAL
jgi:hypothetical protein